MSSGRDDDALSWDGDDDPTLDTRADTARPVASPPPVAEAEPSAPLPEGFHAVGKGSDALAPAAATDAPTVATEEEPGGIGNVTLVALGVLGGVYLLFAIGWIVGGLRLQGVASFLVANDGVAPPTWAAGNAVALVLAVLAPVIWFATVFVLTRRSAAWLRWVFLLLGVVLLVPWPFIMVGAVGS